MSMFKNFAATSEMETAKDTLGGSFVKETDLYEIIIKMLYFTQSDGGAHAANLIATLPDGSEYRETFYLTNKAGQNFYLNRDKKQVPMTGFTHINDLCLMTVGAPLADLEGEIEEKVVKVYDSSVGGQVPKNMPCLPNLEGEKVILAIQKILANKSKKNDATGQYEDIAETREFNETQKVFHIESRQTMVEANNEQEASFIDSWEKRNKGIPRDKRTIKDGEVSKANGAPKSGRPQAAGRPAPTPTGSSGGGKPMFGKKP